ncbi:MAG: PEP/pyruvate-binding domain-containing protein [Thermodesulfobacteriota bacterium]
MQAQGMVLKSRNHMGTDFSVPELVRTYHLYQRVMNHPDMVYLIREIFLSKLEKDGITDADFLQEQAVKIIEGFGGDFRNQSLVREYTDILIDIWFSSSYSDEIIANNINLARKKKHFNKLSMILNKEGITYGKIKQELDNFCCIPEGDLYISPNEAEGVRVRLINHFISNQLPFIGIAKKYITIRDVGDLSDRIIRTRRRPGRIGGKAAGMILAHRILIPRLEKGDPELEKYIRIPDSWYINTGIFSDFIEANGLFHFHAQKYKTREDIEKEYEHIAELFKNASFPEDVVETFRNVLEEIGEHPLILRSSSLLEDNFGLAFSGKYDSVFLANQGDIETRLKNFIWGLKQVHMSTYGPGPILYRKNNNLLDFDEKMSVIVQKVVGRKFGKYFFPFSAGVGFSFSSYSWSTRIKKEEGVMRLVMGLGTRAVNRTGRDYPRMVHLSNPKLRPETTAAEIIKYSQKIVDVLNLETGELESINFRELIEETGHPDTFYALSENRAGHLSAPMFKQNRINPADSCITFDNALDKTMLPQLMKKVLNKLEEAYGRPVDVEFAFDENTLYIVQCRTLTIAEDKEITMPEDVSEDKIVFQNNKIISGGAVEYLDYLVYVDPKAYAGLSSHESKLEIAKVVSRINKQMENRRYALFGPGRWGSNDINLGVKAGYEDINNALVLGEVAFKGDGSTPEVSYGTHFFNDLVESGIVHVAIFPDDEDCFFNEDFFLNPDFNRLDSFSPEDAQWSSVVHVIHIPECCDGHKLNVFQDSRSQKGAGFLIK